MSYDQVAGATREIYEWGQDATFGGTSVTHQIVGPKGCVGFVRDIIAEVTTSLVGTTTVPEIDIGISAGDTTYGRYRLGTATGGANLAYGTGVHRASNEAVVGNPPRSATDFAGHVVLDGGPLSSSGSIAGGSSTTQNPAGRIPAGPYTVTNVINGAGNVPKIFLKETLDANIKVGQSIQVQNVAGATGTNGTVTISAINTAGNWIETSGTFGGTYTAGGIVVINVFVLCAAGVGSPAGGGYVRVVVDWYGQPGF